MYCRSCACEYVDWGAKCPDCGERMMEGASGRAFKSVGQIDYQELLDMVSGRGGQTQLHLQAVRVRLRKKWGFPYSGFGYAWCERLFGQDGDIWVDLSAQDVKTKKQWKFPYRGFGFAWADRYQGSLAGNPVELTSSQVVRKKTWNFPYFGYGRAWVEQMTGQCGDSLKLTFTTTAVGKKSRTTFPWIGYGFAWERRGELLISLNQANGAQFPETQPITEETA